MDHARAKKQPLYILKLDIEKAYDTVDREAMRKCLRQKGFPPVYLDLLDASFQAQVAVRDSEFIGDTFSTAIGIR